METQLDPADQNNSLIRNFKERSLAKKTIQSSVLIAPGEQLIFVLTKLRGFKKNENS